MRLVSLCLIFFLSLATHRAYTQYNLTQIPNPKQQGQSHYVSNPDGILTVATVKRLNAIASDIENHTSGEYAIVVLKDFQGDDIFEFAHQLFEHWGIGKAAKDNGLLLLVAKERRKYYFITGYGLESTLPDARLKRIGNQYILPYFKNDDYDGGIIQASLQIKKILTGLDDIENKEAQQVYPVAVESPLPLKPTGPNKVFEWLAKHQIIWSLLYILSSLYYLITLISYLKSNPLGANKLTPKTQFFVAIFFFMVLGFPLYFIVTFALGLISAFFSFEHHFHLERINILMTSFLLSNILLGWFDRRIQKRISQSHVDLIAEKEIFKKILKRTVFVYPLFPVLWLNIPAAIKRFRHYNRLLSPSFADSNWSLLNFEYVNTHHALNPSQRKENELDSINYQVWKNNKTQEIKIVQENGVYFSDYAPCPKCQTQALDKPYVRVIVAATTASPGKGIKESKCLSCSYVHYIKEVYIPRIKRASSGTASSSSSSGRSSSYSSRSSGSSSSSFGGGRSGGGGAGGSW